MGKISLFYAVLLVSFLIMGLMGCGEEAEEAEEKKSVSGPSISNAIPKNGAKDVPTTAAILVVFNKEIMTPSNANLAFTPGVTGNVSYDPGTRTLVFKPSAPLSNTTDYSMTIDGITGLEGNAMSPVTINFTTSVPDRERPEVTLTSPEDGQKDVGHDAEILIRFSEPMDRLKLRNGISFDPRIEVSADQWLFDWGVGDYEEVTIYQPIGVEPFDLDEEYTMRLLKDSVLDLSGNPIVSDYKMKFRTLKYPVEKIDDLTINTWLVEPQWFYIVGKIGGTKWAVVWGGVQAKGGPSQNNPSGTITASSDGEILTNDIMGNCSNGDHDFTPTVSKGKGNRLTYQSTNMNNRRKYRMIFSATSSYLTFDLRSAAGTIPKQYVNIGRNRVNPSRAPFILRNKQ